MNSTASEVSLGNYSYVALILILIMQFALNIGIANVAFILIGEVFPFKWVLILVDQKLSMFLIVTWIADFERC